jgi:hypothetical protein
LDGSPRCTWTYEEHGQKVTREQPIDAATFRTLWNAINTAAVFHRAKIRDPNRKVDPINDHVVSIVYEKEGQQQRRYFAVPAGENDPEFLTWLKTLKIPTGSLEPQRPSGASKGADGASRFAAAREKAYPAFFGKKWMVRRESPPQHPPIDVYVFEPGEDDFGNNRDFYTLVTSGMSNAAMSAPDGVARRAELLLYVDKPADEHIEVLQWLARLPLTQQGTWYGGGTTMTNGQPPQPIFEGSELNCYLFLFPIVGKDDQLEKQLILDGDPTVVLWVVPITNEECQFILDNSLKDFLDVLDKKKHPFLLNEKRRGYIGGKGKGGILGFWKK